MFDFILALSLYVLLMPPQYTKTKSATGRTVTGAKLTVHMYTAN